MSNAFSELIERATAGEGLNREEIHTLLVDGEGQDFALIEAASVVRRNEFRNMIAIHTKDEALADASVPAPSPWTPTKFWISPAISTPKNSRQPSNVLQIPPQSA